MQEDINILLEIEAAVKRRNEIEAARDKSPTDAQIAEWGKTDLWYFCRYIIGWEFYDCDFAKYFCEQVQLDPNKLYLVARGHLKSLTITCAKSIQSLICDPNKSVAIISYNGSTARSFLRQIKNILETNEGLKKYYPDVFYENPKKESTLWSEMAGINIKRTTTRKEASVYAFGLVDSQLTGMHSDILVYDDVIIQDSVNTPQMINKTTKAWELSANLGMMTSPTEKRYCGTRYHYADTYGEMIDRGMAYKIIPATHNGTMSGKPIHMNEEKLAEMIQQQGSYTFASQMLLKPVVDGEAKFNIEDFQYYEDESEIPTLVNKYLLVDPANSHNKGSDFTAMLVLGYDQYGDVWLVDGIHDKINLGRRWNCACDLSEINRVTLMGYESYGLQADIEYFDMEIKRTRCKFPAIKKLGGIQNKEDRILRLVPLIEQRRFHIPRSMIRTSYSSGETYDLVKSLLIQFKEFPYGKHDDITDCASRILDVMPVLPREVLKEKDFDIIPTFYEEFKQSGNVKSKNKPNFIREVGKKIGGWF